MMPTHPRQLGAVALSICVAGLATVPPAATAATSTPATSRTHQYGAAIDDIAAVSRTDAWAVGAPESTGSLIEHWDGQRWRRADSPQPPRFAELLGVGAGSSTDIWAVGFTFTKDGRYTTYAQHFDGDRWRVVPAAQLGEYLESLSSVGVVTADDAWSVGIAVPVVGGQPQPLIEHWDGHAWSTVAGAALESGCVGQLTDVAALAGSDVWAVGTESCGIEFHTLVEHWNGRRWVRVASPNPGAAHSAGLRSLTIVAHDDIWAVGSTQTSSPTHAKNLGLHWDGDGWTVVHTPNQAGQGCSSWSLFGVSASAAADVWAVGSRACGRDTTPETLHWDGSA